MVISIVCLSVNVIGAPKESRKLPEKAYVKSANILIDDGDLSALIEAKGYLDTLFMYYGQYTEGVFVMTRLMSAFIGSDSTDFKEKTEYTKILAAYIDTLSMKCNDPSLSKRDKKDCEKYLEEARGFAADHLTTFFNNGYKQLNTMNEKFEEMQMVSDEEELAKYNLVVQEILDSCTANFTNAITLDKTHYKSYVGIAMSYEKVNQFQPAIDWMTKGIDHVVEKNELLVPIAYDYIQMNKYCEAIPYMEEYVSINEDVPTMFNLAVCYSNCDMKEKALAMYQKVITIDPYDVESYGAISQYFMTNSRMANDSINYYRDTENNTKVNEWNDKKSEILDSALVYIGKAIEIAPSSQYYNELFATYSAIRGRYAEAAKSYKKLTEMNPNNPDPFIYLGECYINLEDWPNAVKALEKAVELNPSDKTSWTSLSALYNKLGDKVKAKEAYNKANDLK